MSAHVGEGYGYGNVASLNTYIRTLMRGENVLSPQSAHLMRTSTSSANPSYGLGCNQFTNLGYGHNGAIAGYLSVMAYDPVKDVSIAILLPLWDFSKGEASLKLAFGTCTMPGTRLKGLWAIPSGDKGHAFRLSAGGY